VAVEIICEACGWMAIVESGYPSAVWTEHERACPAVGGAIRYYPPPEYVPPPPVNVCKHVPIKRLMATTPKGRKLYSVVCSLCGRHL